MSNVIIKIQDLISSFKDFYEDLKQKYEKEVLACITYEEWNRILQDTFRGDLCDWVYSLALAAENEDKHISNSDFIEDSEITFDFVEDSEITYGINSAPLNFSKEGVTRSLSPACIPSFWTNDEGIQLGKTIIKLISAFNDTNKERRIFNEVHCVANDPNITLGFGHFADSNIETFFHEMPKEIWDTMSQCMLDCINNNMNIFTKQNNTNIHKTYKEQFWYDYNKMFKEKIEENEEIKQEHLDRYFRKDIKGTDRIRNRCKKILESYQKDMRELINHINENKKLDKFKFSEDFIWGNGNDFKHAILMDRIAMKDTYVTKAQRFHESLVCLCKGNITLEKPEILLSDENIKVSDNGQTSLKSIRQILMDRNMPLDYDQIHKQLKALFDKFNIIFDKYKDEYKELCKNKFEYPFTKNDKVDFDDYEKMIGSKNEKMIDSKKKIEYKYPNLQPFMGNVDYNGYWFYDVMKVALRLRSVCYYQLIYWLNHILEPNESSDAAIAARSSWGSSRFPFVRNIKENETKEKETKKINLSELVLKYNNKDIADLRQNYLLYKNGSIVVGEEVDENKLSKALMYWQNYNVLRAWDEKKVEIRGRQEQIWKVWFSPYYTLPQNGYKATLGQLPTPIENPYPMPCNIREELEGYIEFLRRKEPALKNYVLK